MSENSENYPLQFLRAQADNINILFSATTTSKTKYVQIYYHRRLRKPENIHTGEPGTSEC